MNGLMPITYQTLTKTAMMMTTIRSVTAQAEDTTSPVIVYESPWQPKNISNSHRYRYIKIKLYYFILKRKGLIKVKTYNYN